MKPDEILEKWAKFFKKRNEEYGSSYLRHGEIMKLLFPNGITLETADHFYYFHIFVLELVKIIRIANSMQAGTSSLDSWKDLAVYAAMFVEKEEEND